MTGVVGYAETGDPRFISNAGDAAYVVIQLDLTDEDSVAASTTSGPPSPHRPATSTG